MSDLYIDYKEKIGDYKKDGVLYCGNCNKPKQMFNPIINKIVGCYCDCAKQKDLKEKLEYQTLSDNYKYIRNRQECFSGNEKIYTHTFENTEIRKNVKNFKEIFEYCKWWTNNFDIKKSCNILMYGNVGTSKSFLSECIANEILKQGYTVLDTTFDKIASIRNKNLQMYYQYIDELMQYDLLIIDDLGVEKNNEYMNNTIQSVIDNRVRINKPMIITTNLDYIYMLQCDDIDKQRAYDRLNNCKKLKFEGSSYRKEKALEEIKK